MRPSGNTILITGGGSGIGAALAGRFLDQGNDVVIAGRRQEALDAVVAGRAGMSAMTLDVDDPAAIRAFAERVVAAHPALNVVIHNAGVMRIEDAAAHRDLADAEATIATNLLGPIRLTNALIGHLVQQQDAALVTVTSGLGFVPLVDAAVYSATKAAIHSLTVSWRDALQGKVEVIELIPPGVQTGLTPGQATRPGYMPLNDFIDAVMAQFTMQPTPPEIVVGQAKALRSAEAEGRFDAALTALNAFARQARTATA